MRANCLRVIDTSLDEPGQVLFTAPGFLMCAMTFVFSPDVTK